MMAMLLCCAHLRMFCNRTAACVARQEMAVTVQGVPTISEVTHVTKSIKYPKTKNALGNSAQYSYDLCISTRHLSPTQMLCRRFRGVVRFTSLVEPECYDLGLSITISTRIIVALNPRASDQRIEPHHRLEPPQTRCSADST